MEQSVGHIAFVGDFEYYELRGEVHMAHVSNVMDVRTGARIGRWECDRAHWDRTDRLAVLQALYV